MTALSDPRIRKKLAAMLRDNGQVTIAKIADALEMDMDEVRVAKRGGLTGAPMDPITMLIQQGMSAVKKGRVEENEACSEILTRLGFEFEKLAEKPQPGTKIEKFRIKQVTFTKADNGNFGSLATSQRELDPTAIANSRNALENELRDILNQGSYTQDVQNMSLEDKLVEILPSSPEGSPLRQICADLGVPYSWLSRQHGYQPDVERKESEAEVTVVTTADVETAEQAQARASAERAAREVLQAQQALAAAMRAAESAGVSITQETGTIIKGSARKARSLIDPAQRSLDRLNSAIDVLSKKADRVEAKQAAEDEERRGVAKRVKDNAVAKERKRVEASRRFNNAMARADAHREYVANGGHHAEQHLEICKRAVEAYPDVFNHGHFNVDNLNALQQQCYRAVQSGKPLSPEAFAKVQQLTGKGD